MAATELDQIVNLCKRRGFVYPSAEIYGGFRAYRERITDRTVRIFVLEVDPGA